MLNCTMCKKEFEDKDLDFLQRCEPCFRIDIELRSAITTNRLNVMHHYSDGKGSISMAHLRDIKSRRLNPDGSVSRGGKKTYFRT